MRTRPAPAATPLKSRLAERLRDTLRTEIARGRWLAQLPAERVLAREFQVSRPTVHLALAALGSEGWVEPRRGRPWTVVRSARAAVRAARRPEVVLLRFQRFQRADIALTLLTESLFQKLHRRGLGFRAVAPFPHGLGRLEETLAEFDAANRPAFYLLASAPTRVHRWFARQGIPALVLGSRAADVALPAIDLDIEATVRHGVHYVLRRGHRRVALLNVASTAVGAASFHQAFLEACAASGCAGVQGFVENVPLRPDSIEAAVRRLFARVQRTTAVLTNNCELAIGLYTTLGLLGLRIPRDVSVVVCGHWPALEYLRPPVTAYRISWETIATRIARIIHSQLHLGTRTERFWKVVPALQEGGSVSRVAAAAVTNRR